MITLNNTISKQTLKQLINNYYENGLPEGLNLGIENIDQLFRFDLGRLVTITGIPNCGKSEFVDFICTQLNKKHNLKTLYYSPENYPIELHLSKLISKYSNTNFSKKEIDNENYNKIINHITENFFWLNYETVFELDTLIEEIINLKKINGIDILVIDSYNKLESQKPANVTETEYISKILDTLERLAKRLNILIILVAHPRKMEKDSSGNYKIPGAYDINGSANFYNKSDYCLTVYRDSNNKTLIRVDKVKFKNYGSTGDIFLSYDNQSGNYYNVPDFEINETYFDFECKIEENIKFTPDNYIIPENENKNNKIDHLNTQINYFNTISDIKPKTATLKEILFSDLFDKQKKTIENLRKEKDSDRKKVLKNSLANYTVSAIFENERNSKNIIQRNNLICLDIDEKDNLNIINNVFDILKNIDNVLYCAKSCSGSGYFAIIPIVDTSRFLEQWESLNKDFASMGITIDKATKDVTRTRFISFDNDYYLNENATPYSKFFDVKKEKEKKQNNINSTNDRLKYNYQYLSNEQKTKEKELNVMIENCKKHNINLSESYQNWFNIGIALIDEFGENGKDLFNKFSQLSDKYNKDETDEFFDNLIESYSENTEIHLNTIYHLYNEALKENEINN